MTDAELSKALEVEAERDQLRILLRAARKHVDPVIQYRLIEAIDAALASEQKEPTK